jgi:hypothetical protein
MQRKIPTNASLVCSPIRTLFERVALINFKEHNLHSACRSEKDFLGGYQNV